MLNIDSWIRFALTEIYAVVLLAFVFRKPLLEEKKNVWLKILLVMLAMYLAHLFYVLLSPTYFFRRFSFSLERVNWVPFRALHEWLAHPFNFFGNILLFMPIGFFEVLLHPGMRRGKQLLLSAATAAGISLFVEFAQCFNYRVPDVDDIILNTIGAVFGALLCMLLQKTGFDRTRVGRILLPRIPRTWHNHSRLNVFLVALVVSMEVVLFTVNYIVTIPKPVVRENTAMQQTEPFAVPKADSAAEGATVRPDEDELIIETVTEETIVENAVSPTPAPTQAPTPKAYRTDGLELEAQNVLLVKLADSPSETDQSIFAYGSEDMIYPASTLKMLTALTVLDIADPEDMVNLGLEIYIPPLDAAKAGLEYGMTMSIRNLLEALLLPSGADAAYALAVYCGRKLSDNDQLSYMEAVQAFVKAMNEKARNLGALHTTAVNVVGLDDKNQLTTCRDILTIARIFLDNPVLSGICRLPTDKIISEEGKGIFLSNTNKMLHEESPYYNEVIAGVKTGTTSRAGNCLVSVFTIDGERFLCIVMNSSYDGKFTDTQTLFNVCADQT